MALTMTRTRTQTALSRMAQKLAEVNGERAYVQELMDQGALGASAAALRQRAAALESLRGALLITLHQFDPDIDAQQVGTVDTWRKCYGRQCAPKTFRTRYLARLASHTP